MWKLTKKYLKDVWVLLWSKTEVDEKAIATLKEVQKRYKLTAQEIEDVAKLVEPMGALVASVAQNSPSEKAGVKAGDIILEFNGEKIEEMKELPIIVARTEVGKKVKVKIWRNKKEIIKTITLGRLETSEDFKVAEKNEQPTELKIEKLKITVRDCKNLIYLS